VEHSENIVETGCTRYSGDRRSVSLECEVRQGTRPWKRVLLEDISEAGFRMTWLPGMSRQELLRISIPGLHVLSAHIRWHRGNAMGCEFTSTLHVAVLDHIVRCAIAAGQ